MESVYTNFSGISRLLVRDGWRRVDLKFDKAQREFESTWKSVYEEFGSQPQEAVAASARMIEAQPLATALTLAMVRTDGVEVFGRFKRYLESMLATTERLSGYPAVRGIPHVQAGFLYMTASVMALHWESWKTLEKLLNSKFEWYYQSDRAIFSYPFEMAYLFHSQAFERKAPKIHDFFRQMLAKTEMVEVTQLTEDKLLDTYLQAQMLMCLRVAQMHESGQSTKIWPDFGRFYSHRVIKLLDRVYSDPDFASGVLRAFGEDRDTFLSHLNGRLGIVSSVFFKGGPFLYESLESWQPRELHA